MKLKLLTLLLLVSTAASAQVDKIEHFFIISPKARELYIFFQKNFHLPLVWHYNDWGNYASGGLTLGSTPLEFLHFAGSKSDSTFFGGIALEPTERVTQLMHSFDSIRIPYDKPYIDTFTEDGKKDTGYINLAIKNILPGNIYFFTCDYKYRDEVIEKEKKASDSLESIMGGSLGILKLKKITVGCSDPSACIEKLARIKGFRKDGDQSFKFDSGPGLEITKSGREGITKITLQVRSLADALKYLREYNLLGKTTAHTIQIDPSAIDDLVIELTDQ